MRAGNSCSRFGMCCPGWPAHGRGLHACCRLFSPCNPGRPWWHKQGLGTDLAYWIFVPVFSRYLRIWVTVMGTMLIFRITDGAGDRRFLRSWPWPAWPPAALGAGRRSIWWRRDFALYWSHRVFHRRLSVEISCRASCRPKMWNGFPRRAFIPSIWCWAPCAVDVAALLSGISPEIFIVLGPFNTI